MTAQQILAAALEMFANPDHWHGRNGAWGSELLWNGPCPNYREPYQFAQDALQLAAEATPEPEPMP